MRTFVDATGRTWTIALNLGSAMRVRDTLNIDLLQPEVGDPPLITQLGTDEMLLGRVICVLLGDQLEAQKVTEEQVRSSFDGRTLLDAQVAFYAELTDFFQCRGRADRAKAVAAQAKLIALAVIAAEKRISAFDPQAAVDGAMSGSSPAPSA